MGREIGIRRFAAILNKVTDPGQVETIRQGLPAGTPLLAALPYSPSLQRADLEGRSVLGVDPAVEESSGGSQMRNLNRWWQLPPFSRPRLRGA